MRLSRLRRFVSCISPFHSFTLAIHTIFMRTNLHVELACECRPRKTINLVSFLSRRKAQRDTFTTWPQPGARRGTKLKLNHASHQSTPPLRLTARERQGHDFTLECIYFAALLPCSRPPQWYETWISLIIYDCDFYSRNWINCKHSCCHSARASP